MQPIDREFDGGGWNILWPSVGMATLYTLCVVNHGRQRPAQPPCRREREMRSDRIYVYAHFFCLYTRSGLFFMGHLFYVAVTPPKGLAHTKFQREQITIHFFDSKFSREANRKSCSNERALSPTHCFDNDCKVSQKTNSPRMWSAHLNRI